MSDYSELITRAEHAIEWGSSDPLHAELVSALKESHANAATARQIIEELTDPDPCSFDHHGDCQAHGFFDLSSENPCGHAKAKRFLAAEVSQ